MTISKAKTINVKIGMVVMVVVKISMNIMFIEIILLKINWQ